MPLARLVFLFPDDVPDVSAVPCPLDGPVLCVGPVEDEFCHSSARSSSIASGVVCQIRPIFTARSNPLSRYVRSVRSVAIGDNSRAASAKGSSAGVIDASRDVGKAGNAHVVRAGLAVFLQHGFVIDKSNKQGHIERFRDFEQRPKRQSAVIWVFDP